MVGALGEQQLAAVGEVVGPGIGAVGSTARSAKTISTAPRRGSLSSGGMKRVSSWTVIVEAASTTGCSQAGSSRAGRRSQRDPEVLRDQAP